jgi:hypothetical protein
MTGAVFDTVPFWLLFLEFRLEIDALRETDERTGTAITSLGYILEVLDSIPGRILILA